jgi:hypothetical protein
MVILALALGFRLWGIAWGLHDANVSVRPHPDEWTVFYLVTWFNHYHSASPCPRTGSQCFFDWGMAFPYLSYLAHVVSLPFAALISRSSFGAQTQLPFVHIVLPARILSAVLSTATVYVVYRAGLRAYGSVAGLAAALCAALACLLIQLGHFATPDSTTVLLVASTLWAALVVVDVPSMRRFVLCGLLWGLGAASEYHMVLLGLPVAAAWALSGHRRLTTLATACGVALVAFLAVNVYAVIDFSSFLAATEHTLRIRTVDSAAEYGNRWSVYGSPWLYVVRYALGYGAGVPLALWMVVATGVALYRRQRADLILLAWLVPYFMLVSLSPAKFMRYSAPLLPVLILFSGRLVVEIVAARLAWMRVAGAVIGLAVLAYTALYDSAYVGLFTAPDTRHQAAVWLAAHPPRQAGTPRLRVAYEQLPNGLINLPYYGQQHDFMPCFTQFAPAALAGRQSYLMIDSYDLEEHPRFTDAQVTSFRSALRTAVRAGAYRKVAEFVREPTALGVAFSLAGSPHDWRYPDHDITIFRNMTGAASMSHVQSVCYPSLQAAHDALYTGTSS